MGKRAWAWFFYGQLTGPIALFHIAMLAAFQIKREEAEARAASQAAALTAIPNAAPILVDGLAIPVVADVETAFGVFDRHGLVVRRVLAGLGGRPAYIEGNAWPDNEIRCLRLDRIVELADANTGSSINDLEAWAAGLVEATAQPSAP